MTSAILSRFVDACRARSGEEVDGVLRDATSDFLACVREDPAVLAAAAQAIAELSGSTPSGASWLALTLGTSAERNGTAAVTGAVLLEEFRRWLGLLPYPDSDDEDAAIPEPNQLQAAFLDALPHFCQSVVAHLARMPEARLALGDDEALLERLARLEEYGVGPTWVRAAILKTSGSLLALHPASQKGVSLRYENISNCFHLFSLMQAAIGRRIPGGRRMEPTVLASAKGETNEPASDEAWWHYGNPRSPTPELGASIWGEASPRSIPRIDDVQVVLLWPPVLKSRSWDTGFFHPHLAALPSSVVLEGMLSDADARRWLSRLSVEVPRKWWKFW